MKKRSPAYEEALRDITLTNVYISEHFGHSEPSVRRHRLNLGIRIPRNAGNLDIAGRSKNKNEPSDGATEISFDDLQRPENVTTVTSTEIHGSDYKTIVEKLAGQLPDDAKVSLVSASFDPVAWTRASTNQRIAVTAGAWRYRFKITYNAYTFDINRLVERIKKYKPRPNLPKPVVAETFVIVPTDAQIGKTDWGGGTEETVNGLLEAFHKAATILRKRKPEAAVIVDAGDIIENIFNVSRQASTNDRDVPHQIEAAMHVMLSGIEILAPLVPRLTYVAVSSNHGEFRTGFKQPSGDVSADYGIVIAKMIGRALKLNPTVFGHVDVVVPENFMESVTFESSGSTIGVVHSHQAKSVGGIGKWWAGQSHGRMPVAEAGILICGHWHSFHVEQSGDGRWIFVGPASDPGSSWFANLTGKHSTPGVLSFFTNNNSWSDIQIL